MKLVHSQTADEQLKKVGAEEVLDGNREQVVGVAEQRS